MNIRQHTIDSCILYHLQHVARNFSENCCKAYLVGGSVRNMLLNKSCNDWDIVIDGDAPTLARRLADKLGGYYVHMHDKASRIVLKHEDRQISFDISPLQGNTIEADLHQRDFTINAIAVLLPDLVHHLTTGVPLQLIDPLDGAIDVRARRLRAVDDNIFMCDPLRMLRAIRFMMRYSLILDDRTKVMLARDAALLPQVAAQRIHDELYAILEPVNATERLSFLDTHGLFTTLMPEFIPARGMIQPNLHHWDVLEHSLETVAMLEQMATILQQAPEELQYSLMKRHDQDELVEIQTLLKEAEQQGIFRFAALTTPPMKLAALLHDIGKTVTHTVDEEGAIHFYGHPQAGVPLAQQIMRRLSASTQDRRLVQQVVAHHMRPGQLSCDTLTQRAIRRYFVELGSAGIHVAIISLADHLAMRGPEPLTDSWSRHLTTTRLLLTRYIRERDSILPARLVQPEELMRRFNIESGPLVGQLLEYIADAQAEGLAHSKDDVFWLVEQKLHGTNTY